MSTVEKQHSVDKVESVAGDHYSTPTKPRVRNHINGQIGAAHLFIEDENGNVIERLPIPRPTNDPLDPLSWSTARKHMAFVSISFFVFLSNYTLASITPGFLGIVEEFGVTITKATYLLTTQILSLGVGNLFWIPLSLKFGKRPICIISSAIFFAACVWSAKAGSYGSLLGARIIQGFGASSSEALGPAIVADLYFLHERGKMVGIYTFMIASGAAFGGIFAGLAVHNSGDWRWAFWMDSILTGTCFLFITLFQSETNFRRPIESETGEGMDAMSAQSTTPSQYSWVRSLALWGWYDSETPMWELFWRPVKVLYYPAVLFASMTYGICLGWVVLQQTANAVAFPEIYHFGDLGVGNINVANLIGAVVGCILGGPACDWLIAVISKRHNGLFRPETRLVAFILPIIMGPIGLMIWGAGLENHLHWSVPIAGFGITYGLLCMVPAIGITYVVDCYRPLASETLTGMTAFKNTFAFGLSFGVTPWIELDGYTKVSGYMTLIEGVVLLTVIPMYVFGERLRNWTLRQGDVKKN
ncbi:MFS general substrate transporter [Rhizodiscina lignyota]|uniref:MFS general substrate transporter n=1 Tax=Rhizodiscina lignyota TaxID=1504668 RepID=A0A9P4INK2_9PEZI|nr:MFS general substrate transporter [Rhizodiscina lignyota]